MDGIILPVALQLCVDNIGWFNGKTSLISGGAAELYESHNDFITYKITPHASAVRLLVS